MKMDTSCSRSNSRNHLLFGACSIHSRLRERGSMLVAYLVTEECVGSCGRDDDEIYTGKLFRVYTKSHFLEHLLRDTGGHTESILHFKLPGRFASCLHRSCQLSVRSGRSRRTSYVW